MRIIQINNYGYIRGGSDRYCIDLGELLSKNGHDVTYLVSANKNNIVDSRFAVQGFNINSPSILNIPSFIYSFDTITKLRELIKKTRPNVAHLHIYYGQITSSIFTVLKEHNIPIVQTLHEYKLLCPISTMIRNGENCQQCANGNYWKAIFHRCNKNSFFRSLIIAMESYCADRLGAKQAIDHFIAVSNFQRKQLVRSGISNDKISTLHHFANLNTNTSNKVGQYFLYVGRILEDKGIKILLDAYAKLKIKHLPLKIVGVGIEINFWKTYSEQLGIKEHVEWLGFKDGMELDCLYRDCLVTINPSLLNETFGLTCLEALTKGRPVIASNIGALPEVICNEVDGLLVEPGNTNALSTAMKDLSCNPERAFSMGQNGLKKLKESFSKEYHYDNLIRIYNKVIGN